MNNLVLGAIFFLFLNAATAADISYSSSVDPKAAFTVSTDSVTLVDLEQQMTRCSDDDPLICIRSKSLSLGVPREASISQWSFEGSRYEIKRKADGYIFGLELSYEIIEVSGELNFKFLYSRKRGVLIIFEPTGNTLMSNLSCGILSDAKFPPCKNIGN